jgi:hypothetical protein
MPHRLGSSLSSNLFSVIGGACYPALIFPRIFALLSVSGCFLLRYGSIPPKYWSLESVSRWSKWVFIYLFIYFKN